jgi:hypothetical protein
MGSSVTSSRAYLRHHADVAGATASGVCLIHCLLTPLMVSLFPGLIPYLPGDAGFHRALAVGIVLLGALAFIPGYQLHRRRSLLVMIGFGMTLVLIVAWQNERLGVARELLLSIPGSLMLIGAHLLNRTFCRQCKQCEHSAACETTKL